MLKTQLKTHLKTRFKGWLLRAISRLTGRHAVLLPASAREESATLAVDAPYRVEGERLTLQLLEPQPGKLEASLFGYRGHFPTRLLWRADNLPYSGPCSLDLRLSDGRVELAGVARGSPAQRLEGRRLSWHLKLTTTGGDGLTRQTGHYLAGGAGAVEESYYQGDNYVDHEREAAGETRRILDLLAKHGARGPLLEVGCATGAVLAALAEAGIESWGVDISAWAIEQARKRLAQQVSAHKAPQQRAFVCNAESEPLPRPVAAAGPFSTLLLWAVFEHFAEPYEALRRLSEFAAPDALLLINTVNAASLTHHLFGRDWEGFHDWTHLGATEVTVQRLRRELPPLGWHIERLDTHLAWTGSADPTHATLRDWYAADARFRRLLRESEAGDMVTLVARKTESGSMKATP